MSNADRPAGGVIASRAQLLRRFWAEFAENRVAVVALCMLVEPWLAHRRHQQALKAIHDNPNEDPV